MNLIVICSDYPIIKGNAESKLLSFQLNSIEKSFEKITLLPTAQIKHSQIIAGLKHEIIFDFRRFKFVELINFIINFLKNIKLSYYDLQKIKFNKTFYKLAIRSILVYFKSIFLFTFIESYLNKQQNKFNNISIYSFWFDDYILGALLLKKKHPNIKILSGAHGHDLYAERHIGNRIPFRYKSIKLIDSVIIDSNEGKQYLKEHYPEFKTKFKSVNSGIKEKKFKVKSSEDGKFRILTLSRTNPVKRISYLLETLKDLEDFSNFEIYYYHIGGGTELEDLIRFSKKLNFKRFKTFFLGKISNLKLNNFFKESPIDVFLNVSSFEGTPLALIEAMSYSIPVVVTKIGGNTSIGNYCNTNLSLNFKANELYYYFKKINYNKEYQEKLKSKSHSYWLNYHDSGSLSLKTQKIFQNIIFNK